MSVGEIKNDLHKMIVETDDIILLQQIKQYFKALVDEQPIKSDDISEINIVLYIVSPNLIRIQFYFKYLKMILTSINYIQKFNNYCIICFQKDYI